MSRTPIDRPRVPTSKLGIREALTLVIGALLSIVPNLPGLLPDAAAAERLSNWATFTGGLVVGAALTLARKKLL